MKKISFTSQEIEILVHSLTERSILYRTDGYYKKVLTYTDSAIYKLETSLTISLKPWEKTMCLSVVNEKLSCLSKADQLSNAYDLLTSKSADIEEYSLYDRLRVIKVKLGEPTRLRTSYGDSFAMLEKLSKCECIYLSRASQNNVYKIGFIHQGKEASVFEMSHTVEISDMRFSTLTEDHLSYGKRYFSDVVDRNEALKILMDCDPNQYPKNQLQFFQSLLS